MRALQKRLPPHLRSAQGSRYFGKTTIAQAVAYVDQERRNGSQPATLSPSRGSDKAAPEIKSFPQPPPSARGDPAAWSAVLEPFLPKPLQLQSEDDPSHTSPFSSDAAASAVPRLVREARKQGNADVMAYLGLRQGRWEAMLWIANILSRHSSQPGFFGIGLEQIPPIQWPRTTSLDDMTENPDHLLKALPAIDPSTESNQEVGSSLDNFTQTSRSSVYGTLGGQRDQIGQIWQTLGNLILAAAAKPRLQAADIMSAVLRTIVRLHRMGFIPDKVYKDPTNDIAVGLLQPPAMHMLTSKIMHSLTDAEYYSYFTEVDEKSESLNEAAMDALQHGQPMAGSMFKIRAPELGPELWLEFVLWCCLHGGWLSEGATILTEMKKIRGPNRWSLLSHSDAAKWTDIEWQSFTSKRGHESSEGFFRPVQSNGRTAAKRSVENTVSTEVVIAYVDALVAAACDTDNARQRGLILPQIIERINVLKDVLDRDNMSLGKSSWDEIIMRIAENPNREIDNNPRVMENVLDWAESYGLQARSLNAPQDSSTLDNSSPAYVADGCTAPLGLYHRVLLAHIEKRDTNSALRVLARLQNLTDKNKTTAIKDFFQVLKKRKTPDARQSEHGGYKVIAPQFTRNEYPAFFPAIPPTILASLLDLVTEQPDLIEVGQWLVLSEDVDGPLISSDMYADQSVAPALIRFAAETNNAQLLTQITKVQGSDVSGRTLVALCQSRLKDKNIKSALHVLGVIRDHSLHEWTSLDVAMIVRQLIQLTVPSQEARVSREASELLQRLLRGDLGNVGGQGLADISSVAGIVASVSPTLARACSNALSEGHWSQVRLSVDCFDLILDGVVQAYGSESGTRLWQTWCRKELTLREIQVPESRSLQNSTGPTGSEKARLFSIRNEDFHQRAQRPGHATFTGYIPPTLSTLRIIARKALVEARGPIDETSENVADKKPLVKSKSLDWVARTFQDVFELRAVDIDHELEGYLTSTRKHIPVSDLYRTETMRIWRAVGSSNRSWLLTSEQKLRDFARSNDEQMSFDAAPAAERKFLHSLAGDFGLISESFGEDEERAVKVFKTPSKPQVPSMTIVELFNRRLAEPL